MLVNHLKQEHFSLSLFKSEFALARSMYQCTFDSAVTNFMFRFLQHICRTLSCPLKKTINKNYKITVRRE